MEKNQKNVSIVANKSGKLDSHQRLVRLGLMESYRRKWLSRSEVVRLAKEMGILYTKVKCINCSVMGRSRSFTELVTCPACGKKTPVMPEYSPIPKDDQQRLSSLITAMSILTAFFGIEFDVPDEDEEAARLFAERAIQSDLKQTRPM